VDLGQAEIGKDQRADGTARGVVAEVQDVGGLDIAEATKQGLLLGCYLFIVGAVVDDSERLGQRGQLARQPLRREAVIAAAQRERGPQGRQGPFGQGED